MATDKKPIAQIKAVLFDMDGLLIDSEGIYTKVVNDILKPYGKEQTWEIKANLMGKPEREATCTSSLLPLPTVAFLHPKLTLIHFICFCG